jgi:hypothetical protein
MISVQKGDVEMCKLLIDNGVLPFINTPNNVNISDVIKSYVNINYYIIIINHGYIYTVIYSI